MSDLPVLVTAPTGNVGSEVVRALLERGIAVRAGVREPARTALPSEVEAVRFDFADASTHVAAVTGVRALFLLRPTQITRVGGTLGAVLDAAGTAGVQQCVFLSVAGAERQPWLPHRKVEKLLEASPLSWTFLRPNHFMQNVLGPYRRAILSGRLALAAGQGRVSFVDCADLGAVAALAFADPVRHAHQAYHLTGPEAVTFEELTALLSEALDRSIRYEPVGAFQYLRALRREGAALPYAAILAALHMGIRRGSAAQVDPTLGQLLGRAPRTMAEFIRDHASELVSPADDTTPHA